MKNEYLEDNNGPKLDLIDGQPREVRSPNGNVTLQVVMSENTDELLKLIVKNNDYWLNPPDDFSPLLDPGELKEFIVSRLTSESRAFMIRNREGDLVGISDIRPTGEQDRVEGEKRGIVSYYIDTDYQGHGYATDATAVATAYGLYIMHYDVMIGQTNPGNIASQRVLEKAGYEIDGTVKRKYGKDYDLVEYSYRKP